MIPKSPRDRILDAIKDGDILEGPRGGRSQIVSIKDTTICYIQGSSPIYIGIADLLQVYEHFKGLSIGSRELKTFMPKVFGATGGHTCNCMFLLKVLRLAGLAGPLTGSGVAGDPVTATIL